MDHWLDPGNRIRTPIPHEPRPRCGCGKQPACAYLFLVNQCSVKGSSVIQFPTRLVLLRLGVAYLVADIQAPHMTIFQHVDHMLKAATSKAPGAFHFKHVVNTKKPLVMRMGHFHNGRHLYCRIYIQCTQPVRFLIKIWTCRNIQSVQASNPTQTYSYLVMRPVYYL